MNKTFMVLSEDGIHARPATAIVNMASNFKAEIFAEADGRRVTLKSILGVLSLDLSTNDVVTFIAEGEDAAEALEAIEGIFQKEGLGILYG